jgi:3-deoxy-manno-octulosonate cytidylyltransferase (CMP-KDO synthetase)
MNFKIIIPTRMNSTRLPGKPLQLINDMPMIWHVYQRALETNIGRDNIVIATDSEEIGAVAEGFGAKVVMTASEHKSGTDRCAEVVVKMGWGDDVVVVNLQGDEPLLSAEVIELAASTLSESVLAGIATIACPIATHADLMDPNCVKLLVDRSNKAMLFSRSPMLQSVESRSIDCSVIEGTSANELNLDEISLSNISLHGSTISSGKQLELSNTDLGPWLRHIGIYAYRVWTLKSLSQLPETQIEKYERLEQLRAMWYGINIQVACINEAPGHGVDTQEDLDRVRNLVSARVA